MTIKTEAALPAESGRLTQAGNQFPQFVFRLCDEKAVPAAIELAASRLNDLVSSAAVLLLLQQQRGASLDLGRAQIVVKSALDDVLSKNPECNSSNYWARVAFSKKNVHALSLTFSPFMVSVMTHVSLERKHIAETETGRE